MGRVLRRYIIKPSKYRGEDQGDFCQHGRFALLASHRAGFYALTTADAPSSTVGSTVQTRESECDLLTSLLKIRYSGILR
jgi:hypothetical protein